MKKEKIFKVLKYLGVAFIGALVGMSALIGVSSCISRSKTNKTQLVKRERLLPSSEIESIIGSDKVYYAVAKNYSQDGEGVFYTGSISLDNSAEVENGLSGNSLYLNMKLTTNTIKEYYDSIFRIGVWGGRIVSSQFTDQEGNNKFIYNVGEETFTRNNCGFLFTGSNYLQEETNRNISLFTQFFDVYELGEQTFKFAQHINYNAPYGQDIDSYYVNDGDMVNPSDFKLKVILENKPFLSGGYVFDKIQLRYMNAMATSYLDDNGNRKLWTASGFAYFMFMEYVNSATNYVYVVNDRVTAPWQDGSSSGYNLTKNSKWVSEYYRDITFFEDVSQPIITGMSVLNNSSFDGGYYDGTLSNNVGLGNVFDLLRLAFTSWLPIFNIQIIPGITIGLMMFLPLITGIILFIIWLVKR